MVSLKGNWGVLIESVIRFIAYTFNVEKISCVAFYKKVRTKKGGKKHLLADELILIPKSCYVNENS